MSAQLIEVIRTDLTLRGRDGTDLARRVVQYWTPDGELLAEVDPVPPSARLDSVIDLIRERLMQEREGGPRQEFTAGKHDYAASVLTQLLEQIGDVG